MMKNHIDEGVVMVIRGSKHKGRKAMDGFSLDLHVKKRERMIMILFLVNENSVECVWVYGRFWGPKRGGNFYFFVKMDKYKMCI